MLLAKTFRRVEAKVEISNGLRAEPKLLVHLKPVSLQDPTTSSKEKMCRTKVSVGWVSHHVSRAAEIGQAFTGTSPRSFSSESFIFPPFLILSLLAFQG